MKSLFSELSNAGFKASHFLSNPSELAENADRMALKRPWTSSTNSKRASPTFVFVILISKSVHLMSALKRLPGADTTSNLRFGSESMMPFTVFHDSGVAMLVPPNLHATVPAEEKQRLRSIISNFTLLAIAWLERPFIKVDIMALPSYLCFLLLGLS